MLSIKFKYRFNDETGGMNLLASFLSAWLNIDKLRYLSLTTEAIDVMYFSSLAILAFSSSVLPWFV